jgi:hypothetical protein
MKKEIVKEIHLRQNKYCFKYIRKNKIQKRTPWKIFIFQKNTKMLEKIVNIIQEIFSEMKKTK